MSRQYVEKILRARVYDVAVESPLEAAARLSARTGNRVLFDPSAVVAALSRNSYSQQTPDGIFEVATSGGDHG